MKGQVIASRTNTCPAPLPRYATRRRASRPGRPSGFTLVELMMSLIIIGMLVTLLGVAVGFAVNAARRAQVKTEISQLDVAIQKYKTDFGGEYPPCMGVPAAQTNPQVSFTVSREDLFERALRKRFPRFTSIGTSAANYAGVRAYLNTLYSGNTNRYNLDTLDPAEAIVFWLGGPPSVDGSGSIKIAGFGADVKMPLPKTPVGGGSTVPALFEFEVTRLTDVDQDGWPEYAPPGNPTKPPGMPPYVYFDPASYLCYGVYPRGTDYSKPLFACYPFSRGGTGVPSATPALPIAATGSWTSGTAAAEFGTAMPYVSNVIVPNSGQIQYTFWNAKKFQIIVAGPDQDYGGSSYEPPIDPSNPATSGQKRPSVGLIPQKTTEGVRSSSYTLTGAPILMQGEYDNLTNFIDGNLEDYTPQ